VDSGFSVGEEGDLAVAVEVNGEIFDVRDVGARESYKLGDEADEAVEELAGVAFVDEGKRDEKVSVVVGDVGRNGQKSAVQKRREDRIYGSGGGEVGGRR
jgi:hypothetical protein